MPLPNNDGTCEGSYSLQQGGKGTWQIACTNDMGAAGTLKWVEDGGFAKDPTKKIPEEYREKIKIWYLENILNKFIKNIGVIGIGHSDFNRGIFIAEYE